MPNNISQEAALVGHISEKGAPGKDGKTPVKGVDYWTQEDKANIIHDVLESDEYQSVKGLVGTKENPVNFKLLEPGVYVFQGYISIIVAGETVTNAAPCPKELLLVWEVSMGTESTDDELTYEIYGKFGYLFHTDIDGSIFGDSNYAGSGVLGIIVVPSSVKFLGEWPEDKKNEVITEMESVSSGVALWVDEWMADDDTNYVTYDDLNNAIANLATEQYVNNAIANLATQQYVNDAISNIPQPDFSGLASEEYVNNEIQQVSSEIQQVSSVIGTLATTEYVDVSISNITFPPSLTEDQVNALIDAKLGVIENGHY